MIPGFFSRRLLVFVPARHPAVTVLGTPGAVVLTKRLCLSLAVPRLLAAFPGLTVR